jgi:ParB-like chromosome segregation protein Spo0J
MPKATPTLSKFQKFTIARVLRADIKGAPYNPRKISAKAKTKLRAALKRIGLIEAVTVNKKNMVLVGGHQRLAALDALEGSQNYLLDVCMVQLAPKQEKEANLFLNNYEAQGEWDIDALAKILPDVDIEAAGFEQVGIDLLFEDTEYSELFSTKRGRSAAAQAAIADAQGVIADAQGAIADEDTSDGAQKASEKAIKKFRDSRAGYKDEDRAKEDTERFCVVVFNSRAEREDYVEGLGLDRTTKFVPCDQLVGYRKKAKAPTNGKRSARPRVTQ